MTKKEKEEKRCEFAKAAMAAIVQAQWTTNALKPDESDVWNHEDAIAVWAWSHAQSMVDAMEIPEDNLRAGLGSTTYSSFTGNGRGHGK